MLFSGNMMFSVLDLSNGRLTLCALVPCALSESQYKPLELFYNSYDNSIVGKECLLLEITLSHVINDMNKYRSNYYCVLTE